jgi:asparagine synthase (glutamine-hydrolysing)
MHRGPDASGSVEIPLATSSLVLGHTRLSILDLSDASRQPMHDADSGSWLIFNGEIYNFRQLRSELETLGAKFSTSGDTEVLLRALVQWGEAALNKLEGMFAFAFWDGRERNLLLARDRMGIKPLYYCRGDPRLRLRFGSEGARARPDLFP